jgi:hypothetical protein
MRRYIAIWSFVSGVVMSVGNTGLATLWSAAEQGMQSSEIAALESRVERLERIIGESQPPLTNIGGQSQSQVVFVEAPPTQAEIDQENMRHALYAVWIANYGTETANDLLHASGVGRASGEPGPTSGGEGFSAGGATRIAGRSGDGSDEPEQRLQHVHD